MNIAILNSLSTGYCGLLVFFFKINLFKNSSRNTIILSSSLDPGQARYFVGPGLSPNCLQRLTADNTSKQS